MKIGILANLQSPATDIYRSIHPFSKLGYETEIIDPNQSKWWELPYLDILVVSRPNGGMIPSFLEEFKNMGKDRKIIIDLDDNLHKVDPSNPAFQHFNAQVTKDSVVQCLNLADHVIYSTLHLQSQYEPLHAFVESTVIPNAVDFNLTPMIEPKPLHSPIRVLWRGSEHHKRDLETIRPFWNWILQNKDYEVFLMGLQLHDVYAYFQGAVCVPWNPSPFSYWQQIKNLHADVAVFPLENTLFNQSKSNIFALEMLVNGILPIVPDGFAEFDHDGVFTYANLTGKQWEEQVYPGTNFIDTHFDVMRNLFETVTKTNDPMYLNNRLRLVRQGQQWIRENRDLEKVNVKRKEIIELLFPEKRVIYKSGQ
jgi:hypothetical protein